MEGWEAILIALGGNAVLITSLAFLSKLLISEWLKRTTIEHQVVFSKLHEKRADAVSNIYLGLDKYLSDCKSFVLRAEHVPEDEIGDLLKGLSDSASEFRCIFQKNKLYLKKDLCAHVENVFKNSQMPSYQFIFSLGAYTAENITEPEYRIEWEKAFKIFNEELPSLLSELENEFRNLLGSEN